MSDDDDSADDIQALQDTYQMLYKIYKSTPRHCQEIEDVKVYNQHLYLSYLSRKQEYDRFEKQVDAILNDPKVKEKRKFNNILRYIFLKCRFF